MRDLDGTLGKDYLFEQLVIEKIFRRESTEVVSWKAGWLTSLAVKGAGSRREERTSRLSGVKGHSGLGVSTERGFGEICGHRSQQQTGFDKNSQHLRLQNVEGRRINTQSLVT